MIDDGASHVRASDEPDPLSDSSDGFPALPDDHIGAPAPPATAGQAVTNRSPSPPTSITTAPQLLSPAVTPSPPPPTAPPATEVPAIIAEPEYVEPETPPTTRRPRVTIPRTTAVPNTTSPTIKPPADE